MNINPVNNNSILSGLENLLNDQSGSSQPAGVGGMAGGGSIEGAMNSALSTGSSLNADSMAAVQEQVQNTEELAKLKSDISAVMHKIKDHIIDNIGKA